MSIIQERPAGTGAGAVPEPGWAVPGVGVAGVGVPAQRTSPEDVTGGHRRPGEGARVDEGSRAAGDGSAADSATGSAVGPAEGGPDDTAAAAGSGHPIVVAVLACLEALEGVRGVSTSGLGAREIRLMLLAVVQLTGSLFALKLRLLVAGQVQRVQDLTGATSVAAFLAHLTQVNRAEASAQVRLARDLDRRWPLLAEALAAGRMSPEQVKVAVAALRKLPKDLSSEQTRAVQECLIGAAASMAPRELKAVGRKLWEVIDPEGAEKREGEELEDEEELARARAYFRSWRNGDGTTGFRGRLPDVQADMLLKALAAFASPRRRSNPNIKTAQPDDNHPDSKPADRPDCRLDGNGRDDCDGPDGPDGCGSDGPEESADASPGPSDGPGDPGPPDPEAPDLEAPDHDPLDLEAHGGSGPPGESEGVGRSRLFDPDDVSAEERETGRVVPYPVRLGHALMELVERLPADLLPATGGVGASIVVTVPLEKLVSGVGTATLDTGTACSIAQLRRLACEAGLIPAVLDGAGQPLDLGREQRLYTKPQRIAMNLRDKGCRAEGCDRPAAWTVAHHLIGWAQGGRTNIADGAMVCEYHHHLIHSRNWTFHLLPDGKIRFRRR